MLRSNKWRIIIPLVIALAVIMGACAPTVIPEEEKTQKDESKPLSLVPDYSNSRYKEIYLAGGCFWGVEAYFERIVGVEYTNVGYANGQSDTTDYYSIGETGHAETIYLVYDPQVITLEKIITYFYGIIDPTTVNRQANDVGTQYRSGIYYVDEEDLETIQQVTENVQKGYSKPIATEIQELENYVLGEDYHQD